MSYPLRIFLVIAATAAPAMADTPRVGWEAGFGIYGGDIRCRNETNSFCDSVNEAGGFDLHLNYFWSPHLGVTLDIWPMFHSENDWTLSHDISTIGIKWRVAPILTLQAGVGSAQAHWSYNHIVGVEAQTDVVSAIMLGAALEIVRSPKWAIDLQARIGNGFYDEDKNHNGKPDITGTNVGVGAAMTFF